MGSVSVLDGSAVSEYLIRFCIVNLITEIRTPPPNVASDHATESRLSKPGRRLAREPQGYRRECDCGEGGSCCSHKQISDPLRFSLTAQGPLTERPGPISKLVSRAYGFYGLSGQEELGLFMTMNFSFTYEKFKGSSL
ncbi:hypothetical protein HHK36_007001 [Tetracentron sinense]|uniref:Dirigent protein n=1 Tax=Tetracentron sinense TaxID=13715 RepID=A0A834ZI62_TETSI|nr:hypothetical protein HHK36_007001 [Tetracentron sinense]